jgi:sortase (surface protein transpeptidase)
MSAVMARLTLLALTGLSWTLPVVTFLPGNAGHAVAVVSIAVVGAVGWETFRDAGRQLRHRDWSNPVGPLIAITEAMAAYLVLRALDPPGDSALRYLIYFGATWLLIRLLIQGVTRVAAPRRHRGARPPTRPRAASRPARRRPATDAIAATTAAAVAALGLALTLTTDTTSSPPAPAAAPGTASVAPTPAHPARSPATVNNPTARVTPIAVHIPKLGASSTLIKLGLDTNQRMRTPPVTTPMQAGWYEPGPAPGQTGPAVIVGHIDGAHQPGIFYRLHELMPGDRITIDRADHSTVTFVVRRTIHAPKGHFPTMEVYGRTTGPELRLITCGGPFDRAARSYRENTIVFAQLQGEQPPHHDHHR